MYYSVLTHYITEKKKKATRTITDKLECNLIQPARRWTSENSRDSVVALFGNLQSLNGVQVLLTFQTSGSWWMYTSVPEAYTYIIPTITYNILYYGPFKVFFEEKKSRDIAFFPLFSYKIYNHRSRVKHSLVFTAFVCCIIITCYRCIIYFYIII